MGYVKADYGAASNRESVVRSASRAGKDALQGGVEDSFLHPHLEGHSKGRGTYFAKGSDMPEWYDFPGYPRTVWFALPLGLLCKWGWDPDA